MSSGTQLFSELLLNVFEYLLVAPEATLFSCMLCCQAWHPLARSVLYRDVVLSSESLIKFIDHPPSTNKSIQSVTLRLQALPASPDEAQDTITQQGSRATQKLWRALDSLGLCVKDMANLTSLSIFRVPQGHIPGGWPPSGFWIARAHIADIINNLPANCTGLEIDLRNNEGTETPDAAHLCPSIRNLLPQLQYLRLRLSRICPDFCGVNYDSQRPGVVGKSYKPSYAPNLKQCTINICLHMTGSTQIVKHSYTCGNPGPEGTDYTMMLHLRAFLESGQAPALERLRVLSAVPSSDHIDSYAFFLRRDVQTSTSRPIFLRNIGIRKDSWLVRLPEEKGGDFISYYWVAEDLAEGSVWQESERGVRLAAPVMAESTFYKAMSPALTRKKFQNGSNISCMLWSNEEMAGQKLLTEEDGELMKVWGTIRERTPEGWWRNEGGFLERNNQGE